jgi:hypothetical protein
MTTYETMFDGVLIATDEYGEPIETDNGPRCGSCKGRHASTKAIKFCHALRDADMAQQEAEIAAELRNERTLEDRGYWEAIAQRDYEDRNGVIQFDEAYRMACPEAFEDMPIDA